MKHTLFAVRSTVIAVAVLFLLAPASADAQYTVGNNWFVGINVAVDWSDPENPVVTCDGPTSVVEGTAVVSDTVTGLPLLITDGVSAWDGSQALIPGASSLGGGSSSSQSALIAPVPGNSNQLWLFTTPNNGGAVSAHRFDVSVPDGGASVSLVESLPAFASADDERVTTVGHANGTDLWLLYSNSSATTVRVYSRLISGTTVGAEQLAYTMLGSGNCHIGTLVGSPDGSKIGYGCHSTGPAMAFNFDNATGLGVSDIGTWPTPAYGVIFSADSRYMYTSQLLGSSITQYDMSTGLVSGTATVSAFAGSFAEAPDGHIYVVTYDLTSIARLEDQLIPLIQANVTEGHLTTPSCPYTIGLPNFGAFRVGIPPVCGDGEVTGLETCDDGDADSGDGCSDSCLVETGYVCLLPGVDCTDLDECMLETDNCAVDAACANTAGSFTCTCDAGYVGDGVTCDDVDECALETDNCSANAACSNTIGSFTCACDSGYVGDGVTCDDVDECGDETDNCSANAACSNTLGGFECACDTGYVGDGVTCDDVDECALETDNCSANAACSNTLGGFECACDSGYAGDGVTCDDVDECGDETDNCSANAACSNTLGGFECACDAGYVGDGVTCDDVDECGDETDNCSANAACSNTAGGFECACATGYVGDGVTCDDLDECTDETDNCDANATCSNTVGGFECACDVGYAGDGVTCGCDEGYAPDGDACVDVDECADETADCSDDAICTNTAGGFTCGCEDGFTGDGVECTDVDECADGTDDCGETDTCENTAGSFVCICSDVDADEVCDSEDVCVGDDASGDADLDGVCDDQDLCAGDDASGDADADGFCLLDADGEPVDCDDDNNTVFPDAPELCDGLDNACAGAVPDEEADEDDDGLSICEGDCNDQDPMSYLGAAEICDGVDNDCDGTIPADENDSDEDGVRVCEGDCDDAEALTNPGVAEVCGDGVDNDCNGAVDGEDEGTGCVDDVEGSVQGGAGCAAAPGRSGGLLWFAALAALVVTRRRR